MLYRERASQCLEGAWGAGSHAASSCPSGARLPRRWPASGPGSDTRGVLQNLPPAFSQADIFYDVFFNKEHILTVQNLKTGYYHYPGAKSHSLPGPHPDSNSGIVFWVSFQIPFTCLPETVSPSSGKNVACHLHCSALYLSQQKVQSSARSGSAAAAAWHSAVQTGTAYLRSLLL